MSFKSLLDHTVDVYRPVESSTGSTLRSVSITYPSTGRTEIDALAAIQARTFGQEDEGGGERSEGDYQGFMLVGADVRERDYVKAKTGSEAPAVFKADKVYRPRNHHTELVLKIVEESTL